MLLKEGDQISSIFVVKEGSLRAIRQTNKGEMLLLTMGPEDLYGSLTSECNLIAPATFVASKPTAVISINEKFLLLMKPDVRARLLLNVSCAMSMVNQSLYSSLIQAKEHASSITDSLMMHYHDSRKNTASSQILQERLRKLPSLPPYSQELSNILLKENVSFDKIVEHIKSDPPLMALVLKTVNSPYYNMPQRVSDFHHAVLLLGFTQVYQIVMNNSLNNIMPHRPEFLELRDRALVVSAFAFEVALLSGFQRPLLLNLNPA